MRSLALKVGGARAAQAYGAIDRERRFTPHKVSGLGRVRLSRGARKRKSDHALPDASATPSIECSKPHGGACASCFHDAACDVRVNVRVRVGGWCMVGGQAGKERRVAGSGRSAVILYHSSRYFGRTVVPPRTWLVGVK